MSVVKQKADLLISATNMFQRYREEVIDPIRKSFTLLTPLNMDFEIVEDVGLDKLLGCRTKGHCLKKFVSSADWDRIQSGAIDPKIMNFELVFDTKSVDPPHKLQSFVFFGRGEVVSVECIFIRRDSALGEMVGYFMGANVSRTLMSNGIRRTLRSAMNFELDQPVKCDKDCPSGEWRDGSRKFSILIQLNEIKF